MLAAAPTLGAASPPGVQLAGPITGDPVTPSPTTGSSRSARSRDWSASPHGSRSPGAGRRRGRPSRRARRGGCCRARAAPRQLERPSRKAGVALVDQLTRPRPGCGGVFLVGADDDLGELVRPVVASPSRSATAGVATIAPCCSEPASGLKVTRWVRRRSPRPSTRRRAGPGSPGPRSRRGSRRRRGGPSPPRRSPGGPVVAVDVGQHGGAEEAVLGAVVLPRCGSRRTARAGRPRRPGPTRRRRRAHPRRPSRRPCHRGPPRRPRGRRRDPRRRPRPRRASPRRGRRRPRPSVAARRDVVVHERRAVAAHRPARQLGAVRAQRVDEAVGAPEDHLVAVVPVEVGEGGRRFAVAGRRRRRRIHPATAGDRLREAGEQVLVAVQERAAVVLAGQLGARDLGGRDDLDDEAVGIGVRPPAEVCTPVARSRGR